MEAGGTLVSDSDPVLPSSLLIHLKALEVIRTQIWDQLKAAYTPGWEAWIQEAIPSTFTAVGVVSNTK